MKQTNYILLLLVSLFLVACNQKSTNLTNEGGQPEPAAIPNLPAPSPKEYKATAFAEADPEVTGQEVEYDAEGTTMKGYMVAKNGQQGKRPGILVIHEWWGHNDYARRRADMLADLGYVALAVDMYGDGKTANHPDDAGKFSSAVVENMDVAKARFEQAMTTLKAHPMVDGSKIAAVGYCFGGSIALAMANAGYDLAAVGAFHAGVQLPIMPAPGKEVKANILVANGAADPFISPESVAQWAKAMDAAKAHYEYVAFENVKHAYTDPGADAKGKQFGLPLEYNEKSDREAWVKLQALLDESFN